MQNLENKETRRITNSKIAFIASVLTIIGLFFLSYNYIMAKKAIVYEYINGIYVEEKQDDDVEVVTENKNEGEKEVVEENDNDYIGYLKIPKIGFEKGLVDKNSTENDVEKNLYISPVSDYPNVKGGNLIIAGHSGTGWKAFFNDLYKLRITDQAIVTYKNKEYVYTLMDFYKQPKNGKVTIKRNKNKTTLTLITCTNGDSTTQTVYIFELKE